VAPTPHEPRDPLQPSATEHPASPLQAPGLTHDQALAVAAQANYLRQREQTERRRQLRGLLVLLVLALGFSLHRAGLARVFTPGWWRIW
jgi:hypothetical protein